MKQKGFNFEQRHLDIIENPKKFYIQMPTFKLYFSTANDMIRKIIDYLVETNQIKKIERNGE